MQKKLRSSDKKTALNMVAGGRNYICDTTPINVTRGNKTVVWYQDISTSQQQNNSSVGLWNSFCCCLSKNPPGFLYGFVKVGELTIPRNQ